MGIYLNPGYANFTEKTTSTKKTTTATETPKTTTDSDGAIELPFVPVE